MADDIPDRNTLARQLADLRDELNGVRAELRDAQEISVQWSQYAESVADKADNSPDFDHDKPDNYDLMLSGAHEALEKVKDHWYDVGYANALRELRGHLYDAIGDWAEKQGVDIRG